MLLAEIRYHEYPTTFSHMLWVLSHPPSSCALSQALAASHHPDGAGERHTLTRVSRTRTAGFMLMLQNTNMTPNGRVTLHILD